MHPEKYHYFKIYKPYGFLSLFTDTEGRPTLKNLFNFPRDIYPIGRLDKDSEGLLILTNDKSLTNLLLNPAYKHTREYFVQIEGVPEQKDLEKLEKGLVIKGTKTLPAEVEIISEPDLPHRNPPIRFRKNISDSWIKIILTEGKNRQIRRMSAAIGFPTLRLVRTRIENININNMKSGDVKMLSVEEIKDLIKLRGGK